ncbi:MAG: alanine racemase C-terminal domain-containing protein, partial [Pseudomonadota bacterium]
VTDAFAGIPTSLANSDGIWLGSDYHANLTRPGIALYGGAAVSDIPNPMRSVVTLKARIVQIRDAKAGETVSYGAAHRLTRESRLAIVSVGYADGYPRSTSGAGVPLRAAVPTGAYGFVGEHKVPLVGRVTMDLMCFDVTDVPQEALAGGVIELIGPNVTVDDVAQAAGTIGYEILTALGARYQRDVHHG